MQRVTVEAVYEISSPMFLGGASTEVCADMVRPPSFKGVLRFWWRARYWSDFYLNSGNKTEKALRSMHAEESRIFGASASSSGGEQAGGQGIFQLVIEHDNLMPYEEKSYLPGIKYLLGQGLWCSQEKKLLRPALSCGKLKACLYFKPQTSQEDINQVKLALKILGVFGGMGSRSRRGFGSISICSMKGGGDEITAPRNLEELREFAASLTTDSKLEMRPPITAFSKLSRIVFFKSSATNGWKSLLEHIGSKFQEYRRAGKPDVKSSNNSQIAEKGPKWIAFGLPQNYGKPPSPIGGSWGESGKNGRRASPLLFHVHKFQDKYIGVISVLPAQFAPTEDSEKKGSPVVSKQCIDSIDWNDIYKFADLFEARS